MSTILESLKKSSDQRNKNEKSSIDNFNFSNEKKSIKSISWVFKILFFIILFAILYWGYTTFFIDVNSADANQQIAQIDKNNSNAILPVAKKEAIELEEPSKIAKKSKPNSKKVKQQLKNNKEERRKLAALNRKKLAKMQKEKKADKVAKKKPVAKKVATKKLKNTKKVVANKISKKPARKPLKPLVKKKPEADKKNYLYSYELPFSIRKEIPKLKLNIHIYDEKPENRLVVINGVKFEIDDMIDDVVLIKDIIREGVVLEFNEHEFLVPRI